jgi:hypothetical protein
MLIRVFNSIPAATENFSGQDMPGALALARRLSRAPSETAKGFGLWNPEALRF